MEALNWAGSLGTGWKSWNASTVLSQGQRGQKWIVSASLLSKLLAFILSGHLFFLNLFIYFVIAEQTSKVSGPVLPPSSTGNSNNRHRNPGSFSSLHAFIDFCRNTAVPLKLRASAILKWNLNRSGFYWLWWISRYFQNNTDISKSIPTKRGI